MVRPFVALPTVLLLCAALSGCAVFEGGSGSQGALVRIVDFRMDPEAFEEEAPEDLSDVLRALGPTRFEYTHDGGEVDADDVTVDYVDEDGREREVPLSRFTDQDTIGRGDRVTIDGVLMTSQVRLRQGDDTLAKRGAPAIEWLEAGGYPLPLAVEDGALAVWGVSGGVQASGHLDRIGGTTVRTDSTNVCAYPPDEPPQCTYEEHDITETVRITNAALEAGTRLDGELSIDVSGTDADPVVRLGVDGALGMSMLASAHYFEQSSGNQDPSQDETEDADVGFEADLDVEGDGALTFRFRGGDLDRVGAEGDIKVSGSVTAWDDEHPRSAAFHPFDIDGTEESFPYEEEDADLPDDAVDVVATAFDDLWRMDLAAGDEFRFATADMGEDIPTVSYLVRVVEAERLTVPAGTFDTWHVATTTNIDVDVDGRSQTFDLPSVDTWIDQDTGVPVASQQTYAMDLDMADVQTLIDLAREAASEEGGSFVEPSSFGFKLSGQPRMELKEWEGGLQMAPMTSMLSPVWGVAGGFLFGYGFAGMGMLGGFPGYEDDSYDNSYTYGPDVRFHEALADGGVHLTVVYVSDDVLWSDLDFQGDLGCTHPMSGFVNAGDSAFCEGQGMVSVVHLPSNTLLYSTYVYG